MDIPDKMQGVGGGVVHGCMGGVGYRDKHNNYTKM